MGKRGDGVGGGIRVWLIDDLNVLGRAQECVCVCVTCGTMIPQYDMPCRKIVLEKKEGC